MVVRSGLGVEEGLWLNKSSKAPSPEDSSPGITQKVVPMNETALEFRTVQKMHAVNLLMAKGAGFWNSRRHEGKPGTDGV